MYSSCSENCFFFRRKFWTPKIQRKDWTTICLSLGPPTNLLGLKVVGDSSHLVNKWLLAQFISHLGHLEGVPQPQLGDLLTMAINHFLSGMILQAIYTFTRNRRTSKNCVALVDLRARAPSSSSQPRIPPN